MQAWQSTGSAKVMSWSRCFGGLDVNFCFSGFVSIQVQRMAKSGFWFKRSYSAISRLAKNDTLKNQGIHCNKFYYVHIIYYIN